MIYVVQCTETRRIKVGFSRTPKKRFSLMQTDSPTVLVMIGEVVIDEGVREGVVEKKIHGELADHLFGGEWFHEHEQVFEVLRKYGYVRFHVPYISKISQGVYWKNGFPEEWLWKDGTKEGSDRFLRLVYPGLDPLA